MMELLDSAALTVRRGTSPVGFWTTPEDTLGAWWRFLTIDSQAAYHLGNICETCEFLFERMEGANRKVEVKRLVSTLAGGVESLSPDLVKPVSKLMPAGDYRIALLRFTPSLVMPGEANDYFAVEQIENMSEIDAYWHERHDPRVPYYRPGDGAGAPVLGPDLHDGRQFEFIVPIQPEDRLEEARIEAYARAMHDGAEPTALAVAVLDVKGPATDGIDHWCLAFFLLDGHHKLAAAARAGRPLTMIAFIALDRGISNADHVEIALRTYSASADAR